MTTQVSQFTVPYLHKYIVLELRTFVLKNRVSTFWYQKFSILERNGEKRKVK